MVRTESGTAKRLPRHLRNEDIPSHTFTPRTYQVELLDAALQKNTIVCLGSSGGNTFLSVMLLKEFSTELRKQLQNEGKRSVVCLSSDDRIQEMCQVIKHHSDLNVISLPEALEEESDSKTLLNDHQILVTKPSVFSDLLLKNILLPGQISLVILENCHLVLQQDHPYQSIMKIIHSGVPKDHSCRILGLTSSFISQKCQDPEELGSIITSLEDHYHAKAETATLVIAERYGIRPKEYLTYCDNYEDMTGTLTLLDDVLSSALEFLRDCNMEDEEDDNRDPKEIPIFVFTECLHILYTLGPWCASCIANMFINQIEKVDKHEMVSIHKKFLKYCLTHLRIVTTLFEQNFTPNYDVEELLQYSTPRVYQLVNHLRKYKPDYDFMIVSSGGDMEGDEEGQNGDSEEEESEMSDDSEIISDEETDRSYKGNILHIAVKKEPENENQIKPLDPLNLDNEKYLCGIIFVDHRYVALAINKFLEEVCSWDENLCFVKSQHLTGQGLKDRKSKKGVWKKQEDVLRKFRLQDLNLLISTTVLEDGIDVPKCNLIVKFDPPRSYKSYSQSKGRARARDSEYLILVEENKKDTFMKDYSVFKGIESVLIGKKIDDEESDVEDCLYENGSSVLPSYLPNAGNPQICVTMNTAIAFVNRYCAKLPSDAFTHLTPKCTMQETCSEEGKLYVATLSLPINSPYKHPVQGEPMPTKNLAKKAVALKLCECLHKAGELDDQLNPVGKEVFSMEEEEEEEDLLEMEDGEDFSGEGRPGTTKRKQYYFKKLAGSLLQSHPTTEECMLYNVTLQLSKAISDEQNTRGRKICAPEDTLRGFGILTSKPIPQVPTFPVYTRSGEVNASIDLLNCNVSLSSEELRRLREFHRFTFTNVLRLEKDPMEFCSEKSELGYLIVPLDKDGEGNVILDWGFIKKVEDSKSHIRRNIYDSKREEFVFLKEEYEDAVVMPSYRNVDQPQHFYVAEIRSDLNPSSPFPSPELYKTFCAYYTTKYGLTITNQDQPLLDVDHTSARLNLLTPRYMNQKGVALPTSSAETKKARRENLQQKQILVPELCEIHVFPASLWRKAVCLPTILYRLNYLLVADEIRLKIAGGTGIGLVKLEEGFRFQPLDFGFDPKIEEENGGSANLMNDNEEHDESINKSINGCDSGRASHISCDNNSFTSEEDACDTKKASCDREQNISVAFQNDKAANNVCDIQSNKSDHSKCGKNGFLKHDDEWVETLQDQSISKKLDKVHVISEKSLNEMTAELNEMKMTAELNEMNTHVTNSPSKNNQNYEPIFTDFPDVGVFKLQEKQCGHSSKIEDTKEDVKFPELSISLDQEVDLSTFVGPSPCTILQALTMSNANDFFSLERLETIGDSFLKYAITVYLYCTYPGIHEGKLSYLRSKQVSNCNLYRLGKRKGFAECMISTKFEPYENWLPPGYIINDEKRKGPVPKVLLIRNNLGQLEKVKEASIFDAFCQENASLNWIPKIIDATDDPSSDTGEGRGCSLNGRRLEVQNSNEDHEDFEEQLEELETLPERVRQEEKDQVVIPYNLQTLHSIPDKSIADCVESLIGCYLTSCGKKAALKFMHWLGLKVLPQVKKGRNENTELLSLQCPESPILAHVPGYDRILCRLLEGYSTLEQKIGYEFKDKSYLLQAFTHASYHYNTVTDCYQRLEFLGDAILDYVITRHLYEDSCKYSPGVLTDLRSALVNNNIFAALAVKWDFHKYFKAISPPLFGVIEKFVARQKEREDEIDLSDDEGEGEDEEHVELEVPKALGDIFESLAGAIYLDSGMSLDTVWKVYYRIMKPQIDKYLKSIPKSPVRELLEMEPETAKFEKPERTLEGKIRVSVNVVTKGVFTGVGRNYRIAKSAAAKKALRSIKAMQAGGLI